MANYVNQDNSFEQEATHARDCPHCGTHAQLIPVSTPTFDLLVATRPRQVALGFCCSACGEPRFGKVQVHSFEPDRVVLSSNIVEIERGKERFQLSYLPDTVRRLFSEALDCYAADCHNAFASMCRRTAGASIAALAPEGHQRWRHGFDDAVALGEIDAHTTAALEAVLFGDLEALPEIGAEVSAVLIELMKDILYQTHVRTTKFKTAMKMRRFFAEENKRKVTSFRRRRGHARSA